MKPEQKKIYDLACNLLTATEQHQLKWEDTAEENTFRAVLKSGLVRIEKRDARNLRADPHAPPISPGATSRIYYELVVLNGKIKEVGRYTSSDSEDTPVLKRLWELAYDSAQQTNDVIDGIMAEVTSKLHSAK